MKKFAKLFFSVMLIPLSMALYTGCDDNDVPPVDEGDPANPTLFQCVLTVLDDETSQPRANQSVTIKRTNKAGDVVHSTQDYTTDSKGKVAMEVRSGYYTAAAAFEPGKTKDNLYPFEIAYHLKTFTMRVKDMNPDIYPHESVITVKNAKTGSAWANKSFDLYSVSGTGVAEKLGTYTTNASGKYTAQLLSGRYRLACAYFNGVSPLTNTADFQIKRDLANTGEIIVEPIHFSDDFSWILPEWGEAGNLAVWYATIDPPAANSTASFEIRWDLVTREENIKIRDASGWTTPETLAGNTSRFIFFRPGMLKFGSASRGGALTSPAFTTATAGSTIKFSFDSNPMHVVSGANWAIADSGNPLKVKVKLSGSGSMKDATNKSVPELTLDNPSGLNGVPAWPVDRWNKLEVVIYDAGPDTKVTIESNVLNGPGGCRSFIDNVLVKDVY